MSNHILYQRIYALIVDLIIVNFFIWISEAFLNLKFEAGTFNAFGFYIKYGYTAAIIIYIMYFIFFDILYNGDTVGKFVFSLHTVETDGTEMSLKRRIIRSISKTVAIGLIVIPVIYYFFTSRDLFAEITKTNTYLKTQKTLS
jgi:uncharacterized RDD family membrane protein YckC